MHNTAYKPLLLGDIAPDFTAKTTEGLLSLHEWMGKSWCIFFSHPKGFTPVCTTELGRVAKLKEEFDRRNVKAIALSVDSVEALKDWVLDINTTQNTQVNFPIISDLSRSISELYGMIHPHESANTTVRGVFIIDPTKKIRMTLAYPQSTGRSFSEILRVIDSLQLTDNYSVATPADWKQGEDCVILPSITDPEILKKKFPKGWKEVRPYLRLVSQPSKD